MKNLPARLLAGRTREYSIGHLLEAAPIGATVAEERRLLVWVLPPWQRDEVWTTNQKRRFIEGVFLGLGTGFYVVHAPDWDECGERPMAGWLIDGQQRLSAIRDFIEDKLEIFDGIRYSDLDKPTKLRRFLRVSFPCLELEYQEDEERLRELYSRLNFSGTAHTAADLNRLISMPPLQEIARA